MSSAAAAYAPRTAENHVCLEQPMSKPEQDPEVRFPGAFFSLAEVKLEFSPNCFQFLLAVLPLLQGLSGKKGCNFHSGLFL